LRRRHAQGTVELQSRHANHGAPDDLQLQWETVHRRSGWRRDRPARRIALSAFSHRCGVRSLSARNDKDATRRHLIPPPPWGTVTLVVALAGWLATGDTAAQDRPPTKIWDVALGTPVTALPHDEFVDPACGTNGGPPARTLKGFDEFAQCALDPSTGLHEVWFRYDDEREYIARARRSELLIRQYSANTLAGQPIITS